MCGIAGILNLNGDPIVHRTIKAMTDIIAHRGPDGEGHFIDGNIALGHRRLAIIDLTEAGHQPMANEDGTVVISYNGEVYNFKALRNELKSLGHAFHSKTDTEVVVHAYEEWGIDCVDRLNGMFAFALWDKKNRMVHLCRDRYGIKPLYYYLSRDILLFASEIKAILQHPEVRKEVDSHALLEYFTFQNIFTDRTLFEGIKLLPPGHILSLRTDGSDSISVRQYWDYDFREPLQVKDMAEYEEELDRLFVQAVRRQLVGDVPIGAYLSGGMDSGAITALAAKKIPYLTSFTCGFDLSSVSGMELHLDERERAEALSYRFKTEHYEVVLKAGDMERVLPDLIWHLEDLRVGQCYPNYYVSRLASKFVRVILAGTGGDELFAGYPWRYYRAVNNQDFGEYVQKYYKYWQRLVPNKVIHRLFQPHIWEEIKDTLTIDIFRKVINSDKQDLTSTEEYINRSLYFESKTFLHGLLLVEDKLSMAHSLESRVPFLDNDLVDFAMQIPLRAKLRDLDQIIKIDENESRSKQALYFEKTDDGKIVLRNILARYLSREYVNGIKQGFSAPDASWFRGDSINYVRALLMNTDAYIYKYLREDTVVELVNQHLRGEKNRRLLIWSLLCFEWWLRTFIF